MTEKILVSEPDVLFATVMYLIERKAIPYQFSVARGRGIDRTHVVDKLESIFARFDARFVNSGPDVLAISESEWWQVECKGLGTGGNNTLRNNMDRALASVVSYYEDEVPAIHEVFRQAHPYLGLAVPAGNQYMKELRRRIRQPLRMRLNLWILLYKIESKTIHAVAPTEVL